ncbi:MAG: hypothetical protein PF961_04805 [Planctomycetota bacterium]|jgi:subtilase family serine protease|nr:hypothetical protein [Planctomycetota bacterium]
MRALLTVLALIAALVLNGCTGISTDTVKTDLEAGAILLDPGSPGINETVNVTVKMRNIGAASNKIGFVVRLLVTKDGLDVSDVQQRYEGAINENELVEVSFSAAITDVQAGTYLITSYLDYDDEVDEVNEDNNTSSTNLVINAG